MYIVEIVSISDDYKRVSGGVESILAGSVDEAIWIAGMRIIELLLEEVRENYSEKQKFHDCLSELLSAEPGAVWEWYQNNKYIFAGEFIDLPLEVFIREIDVAPLDPEGWQKLRKEVLETVIIREQELPEIEMVFVKGGWLAKNGINGQPDSRVWIDDFYIGKYPVTQRQAAAVLGEIDFEVAHLGPERPWTSIQVEDFIESLNKITRQEFRIPSTDEWEYAARGGQSSKGYIYAGSNDLDEAGWYEENSERISKSVGKKIPNELGIYDLSGNVWEYTIDWFGYLKKLSRIDELQAEKASDEAVWEAMEAGYKADLFLKGGSYLSSADECKINAVRKTNFDELSNLIRCRYPQDFGFRLARSV